MASSSSSSTSSCVHCQQSSSESLMNGWKSRNGEYAQLCRSCYSIYEAGLFCETFHSNEDGWRDCNSCGMLVHCGCIVSFSDYSMGDLGGIVCVKCSTTNDFLTHLHLNDEINPQDLVTPSISTSLASYVHLFEKSMTSTNVMFSKSRIVIPHKHAKAFFPKVSAGQTVPFNILDTDGNEWDVSYRCLVYKTRTTYVLQGLQVFILSKNLQAGDTVAFYRRESDEKIIVEVKKTSLSSGVNLIWKVTSLST